MNAPPSVRIVDEIRRRITDGEIRAGERVPSTRQITQEWGVAMATATKVLMTLRQEGLVEVVPGIGTVASTPMAPPSGIRRQKSTGSRPLNRDVIVRVAIDLVDTDGLGALSMRRIATTIGVATMSLYRYVPGKEDLLLLMADAVFGEVPLPATPPDGWRAGLEFEARAHWTMYRRHPWMAQVMSFSRPLLAPNGMAHTEWAMRAIDGLGLAPADMLYVTISLAGYVRGIALNLESEAAARQETGLTDEEWMDAQTPLLTDVLSTRPMPLLAGLTQARFDFDLDVLFEFGLRRMLDGIGMLVEHRPEVG